MKPTKGITIDSILAAENICGRILTDTGKVGCQMENKTKSGKNQSHYIP